MTADLSLQSCGGVPLGADYYLSYFLVKRRRVRKRTHTHRREKVTRDGPPTRHTHTEAQSEQNEGNSVETGKKDNAQ